jgi:hypothetical protein
MKAPAIVATLTVVGSLAFAAGRDCLTKPQDWPSHLVAEDQTALAASGADPCDPPPGASWFGSVYHPIEGCPDANLSWSAIWTRPNWDLGSADVNADGGRESYWWHPRTVVSSGVPQPAKCMVSRVDFSHEGNITRTSLTCVGDTSALAVAILQQFPNCTAAGTSSAGWNDMDGDGDLDLIVYTRVDAPSLPSGFRTSGWLENIGYERPAQPLTADLNQDGYVNGLDLGLLLGQWGPNS